MALSHKLTNPRFRFFILSLIGSILGFTKVSFFSRLLSPASFSQYVGFFSLVILSTSISGFGLKDSLDSLLSRSKSSTSTDLVIESSNAVSLFIVQSFLACLLITFFAFPFDSTHVALQSLSLLLFLSTLFIFSLSNFLFALVSSYSRIFPGSLVLQSNLSIFRTLLLFFAVATLYFLKIKIGPIQLALVESLIYLSIVGVTIFFSLKLANISLVISQLRITLSSRHSLVHAIYGSQNLLLGSKVRFLDSISTIILSLPLSLGPFLASRASSTSFSSLFAVHFSLANIFIVIFGLYLQTVFSDIAISFSNSLEERVSTRDDRRPVLRRILLRIFAIFFFSFALIYFLSSLGFTHLLVYSPYTIHPLFSSLFVMIYLTYALLSLPFYCLILKGKSSYSLVFSLTSSLPFLALIFFSSKYLSITQFLICSPPIAIVNIFLSFLFLRFSSRLGFFRSGF